MVAVQDGEEFLQFLAADALLFEFGSGGGDVAQQPAFEIAAGAFKLLIPAGVGKSGSTGAQRCGSRNGRSVGNGFRFFGRGFGGLGVVLLEAVPDVHQIVADIIASRHNFPF